MPYKKNRNNKSHKSTHSTESTKSIATVDSNDDGFGGLIKTSKPSSRKTTPTSVSSPRPDFLEPLSPVSVEALPPPPPPPTPWDILGMTEQDFLAMQERVFQRAREYDRQIYVENMLRDLKSPSYWTRRIEILEKEREYFNKKRAWSAAEMMCVERIDAEIQECEDELDHIYGEEDRVEYEYD